MSEYEINIRTKGDTAAADKVKSSLTGITQAAKDGASSGGLFGSAIAGAAARLATFAAALKVAKDAITAYAEAQEASVKLDAALAQRGQLTDAYRERLQALASQLQGTTAIADDQWMAVLTRLTQFGADPSNIEQYADAVKNLAGIMGGDVNAAAQAVSRALQGNFTMLARYGIHVNEAATETEKLNQALKQIAERGAGQLEAAATGLIGQWKTLKNATGDLMEAIGGGVAKTGILQRALSMLSTAAEYYANKLGGVIPKLDGLTNAQRKTTLSLEDGDRAAKAYTQRLEEIKKAADAAAKATDLLKDRITAAARAQQEIADIGMAEQLADVDIREKLNLIGAPTATKERASIQKNFALAKLRREQQRDEALISADQRAIQASINARLAAESKLNEQRGLLPKVEAYEAARQGWEESQAGVDASLGKFGSGEDWGALTEASAHARRGGRRGEAMLAARRRLPRGAPDSATVRANIEAAKRELDALTASSQAVTQSRSVDIETLQGGIGLRANIAPRQIALDQQRAALDVIVQREGSQAADALRASGEAYLRQLRSIRATALEAIRRVEALEFESQNINRRASGQRNR